MSRVLYIINNLDIGGAERHLQQVLPRLFAHGFSPSVYTISYKGELATRFEEAGVPVLAPPFAETLRHWPKLLGRPLLVVGSAVRLWLLLWTLRPRIVHFFLPHAYVFGGFVSLFYWGARRIMSRRSLNNYQQRYPVTGKLECLLHPFMNAVLGNSRRVCQQLAEEGIPKTSLGLIYNGLDLSVFKAVREPNAVRAELGINADALVIVLVANLIFYKGHTDLLNALALIRDELPSGWRMVCVGRDTGIGGELKQQAIKLGIDEHVLWLGERTDAIDWLGASDIGLLTSHEEGFSNSILEGMACGLPMVVTDVGGNPEAVVDGENGFTVPSRNPEALSQVILKLAQDLELRKSMGAKGRQRVHKLFGIDRCVDLYAALYKTIATHKNVVVAEVVEDHM